MFIKETNLWLSLSLCCIAVMGYLILTIEFDDGKKEVIYGCGVIDDSDDHLATVSLTLEEETIVSQGIEIFNGNCAQCHAVNEKVIGPALKEITSRRDIDWLVNFIKYPQKAIDGGDPYAKALYQEYNKQYMPNHDFLNDEEIKSIIAYIDPTGYFNKGEADNPIAKAD